MGVIYCGPFTTEIDEGTEYGHEGYAVQVLDDGTESRYWVRGFREYRAGCACGWRGTTVHPPTDSGEDAALDQWDDEHLQPLVRAVAAGRVVPVTAVLELIAELRGAVVAAEAARGDERLTEREVGQCDVIEVLESRLEDLAVELPEGPCGAVGGAR